MKKITFSLLVFSVFNVARSAQAQEVNKDSLGKYYKTVTMSRVSVHDPSIVTDNSGTRKQYYVYGSHRACGTTTDLKSWTWQDWTYGIQNGTKVTTVDYKKAFLTNMTKKVRILQGTDTVEVDFGNFDCLQWRYTETNADLAGNQWAPDVIWNPYMQKWCMYMSLNGDNWRSVIVLLTADKITGPYIYQGPVVFSGFQWTDLANQTWKQTDITLVQGLQDITSLPARYLVGGSWGRRWPNNIDPTVFFDDDGQMWMGYGSWSGGIFMLKLDRNTGLRDYTVKYAVVGSGDGATQDPYFGKKIAGGYYSSGEGAYIEKIGKYYYLFISYGGLNSDGGYEMRYYRSTKPDGPYKDIAGVSAVFNNYVMNYGPNAGSDAGTRLFGSYKWDTMSDAELAQGHNSALLDDDGKAYLFYHTRFAGGGEGHQLRVHQLFQNYGGWLVASPYEYMGLSYKQENIDSTRILSAAEIAGTYRMMLHPYRLDYANKAYQTPVDICLTEEGRVTGDYTGSWSMPYEGKSYIKLIIRKGSSGSVVTYNGVVLPQQVSGTTMRSVCFSAVATTGVAIWGSCLDGRYVIDYNYSRITLPVTAYKLIKEDIDPTITTYYGMTYTFSSDHPNLISDEGKLMVTPSTDTSDPITNVVLTWHLEKDNYYYDVKKTVRVRCSEADAIESVPTMAKKQTDKEPAYDLSGRLIKSAIQLSPKIMIVNGKKTFVQ